MSDKDTFFSGKTTIRCKGRLIDLSQPRVMGILNITPDSFYDGGRYTTEGAITGKVDKMISEGADFIDIGACSTRPGADEVSTEEEIKRLDTALKIIRKKYADAILSVDTFRPEVVLFAVREYGVDMINDITAGGNDEKMFETISRLGIPYIMMHMQGTPRTMQNNPHYDDVVNDLLKFFSEKVKKATLAGIADIIVDPGFGFGKTIEHNYALLGRLGDFKKILELPVMAGLSRKSMIYKHLGVTPEEAHNGTTVLNTIALMNGASILRVHDVKEAREAIRLTDTIKLHHH
ncbi:MAG: dihydropteroate synthase [Bacteroidales bacterium]|nr:dihydropteroate synthase [Bacteroidales bacterium]